MADIRLTMHWPQPRIQITDARQLINPGGLESRTLPTVDKQLVAIVDWNSSASEGRAFNVALLITWYLKCNLKLAIEITMPEDRRGNMQTGKMHCRSMHFFLRLQWTRFRAASKRPKSWCTWQLGQSLSTTCWRGWLLLLPIGHCHWWSRYCRWVRISLIIINIGFI